MIGDSSLRSADQATVPLLPCPFCGGDAIVHVERSISTTLYYVRCDGTKPGHCNALMPPRMGEATSRAAGIAAWNRRTPQKSTGGEPRGEADNNLPALEEELRGLLEKIGAEVWIVEGDERAGMEYNNHIVTDEGYERVCFMAHGGPALQERFDAKAELIARAPSSFRALLSFLSSQRREIERLKTAAKPFADIALLRDKFVTAPDMIDAPDLAITPQQVRELRAALQGDGKSNG